MKVFLVNMAETRFKSIDIHEGAKRLQRCHICDNEFNKYELELHFLTFHTDIENDDCDDQTTVDGPGFESDLITNNESDDKKEFQNVRYFKSENNLNEQNIIDENILENDIENNAKDQKRNIHGQISSNILVSGYDDRSNFQNLICVESETNSNIQNNFDDPIPINYIEEREKSFAEAQTLMYTVQEGLKNYKCDPCGKLFSCNDDLRTHFDTIHEDKYYKCEKLKRRDLECDICKKVFTTESSLQNHISCIHDESKNFQCKICEKEFATKSSQKIHTKTIHEDGIIYKCDSCDYACNFKGNLTKHIKKENCQNWKLKIFKAKKF